MSRTGGVLPLVWLVPPGTTLPEWLPPVGDLAAAEPGTPRLAALKAPVDETEAETTAARLAALPGVVRAGWLEASRATVLTGGGRRDVAVRVGRGWSAAPGGEPLSPAAAALLAGVRVRLVLRRG